MRILLIKLCVIRVRLLDDLKHKGRRKFPPVQNTCQQGQGIVLVQNAALLSLNSILTASFTFLVWKKCRTVSAASPAGDQCGRTWNRGKLGS